MKKFSKIVAGVMLASMTMLSACANAEQAKIKDNIYGVLHFAQPIDKVTDYYKSQGYVAVFFDDLNSMILALQAKRIDRIEEVPKEVAEYICKRNDNIKPAIPMECDRGNLFLRMGAMQNNTKVTELLNSAINELQESGKLEALQKKYVDAYLQKGKEPKPVAIPKFKDAQVIKVAVTGDLPPIDLVAADGTPAGFNVAMLAEIAKLKKVNIIPIPMNSGARFLSLSKGIVDVVFLIDEAIYNDPKDTEFWGKMDVPNNIKTTDAYMKCVISDIIRK